MKKFTAIAVACLISTLATHTAFAYEIGKPVAVTVPAQQPTNPPQPHALGQAVATRTIYLMGIQLSAKEQTAFNNFKTNLLNGNYKTISANNALPASVDLGMNNVPVLDQGAHGSCVTFATTAALDAALGKGDYVSQLCSLELGSTLEKDSYYPSGWDGSLGTIVLDQMFRFGIVSKTNQATRGCAGVKDYPGSDPDVKGKPMSEDEYKSMSENLMSHPFYFSDLLNPYDRDSEHFTIEDAERNIIKVKEALARGERVVIGSMLFNIPNCFAGACGKNKANNDSWVITKDFYTEDGVQLLGGHELVIYGYDDNAVAVDHDGKQHRGLFHIRNSWGKSYGNQGNFEMSYEYFMVAVGDIQIISKVSEE